MNRPAITDPESLRQFLQAQHFRHRSTRNVYGCVLRNFQHFVFERAPGAPPSTLIVRQWLKERIGEWPLHMVCHRAGVVDRYLRWMEARGAVPNNPFADLRLQYGRRTTPIVRALLSDDPQAALERLRPPPRFGSFLGKVMEEHVGRMRSVGYRYDVGERVLLRFDRFLQDHPELTAAPLPELVDAWSQTNPRPQHICEAQEAGRLPGSTRTWKSSASALRCGGGLISSRGDLMSIQKRRYDDYCWRLKHSRPRRQRSVLAASTRWWCSRTARDYGSGRSPL
jgi:integrase/recombinase XerD